MRIIKGSSIKISGTAYLDQDETQVADLTGATIEFIVKRRVDDADGSALFTKTIGSGVTVVSAVAGTYTITISPSDTNSLLDRVIYRETVIKLSGGGVIRNGRNELNLYENLKSALP
jgi:hypothetical protein